MFFGALAQAPPGFEPHDEDGFVIITAASDQGMVDVHDRKPLVLTPEHVREWLNPNLPTERAEEIAKSCSQPTEDFEWFPVDKAVGNVKSYGPALIDKAKI